MHRFMPALVRREGGVVIQAPVRHRARQQGNSKYRILDRLLVGISDIMGVMWLRKRTNHPEEITETLLNKSNKKTIKRQ